MRAKPRLSLTCGITLPPFPHMALNLSCCVLWLCEINFGRQLILINYKQHAVFQNFTTQSTQLKFLKYSNFICLCAEFCPRKWSTHNTTIQANHVSLLYFQIFRIFNFFSNFTAMYTKLMTCLLSRWDSAQFEWLKAVLRTKSISLFLQLVMFSTWFFPGSGQIFKQFVFLNSHEVWIWRSTVLPLRSSSIIGNQVAL